MIGAATAMSAGDAATTARLCGAIAAQRDALGDFATLVDVLRIPDPERRARQALGDAAFESESARGRALSLDDAIQLAVRDASSDRDSGGTGRGQAAELRPSQ